jgi:allantoinase
MPLNNLPVTTTVEAFDLKLEAMRRSAKVDYGLWAGLIPGNLDQIEPLVARGAMGFKAFMCPSGIDEFPACDEATLLDGMERIAEAKSILLVHAEDPRWLLDPKGPTALDFIESRPPEAETEAIATLVRLAEQTGCPLHVVHVSTAAGSELIYEANQRGLNVTCETCPHYRLYTSDDLERLGGPGKCAPPFRTPIDLSGIRVPMVVSDHSPCTLELKQGNDFRKIWGGISGCQSTRHLLLAMEASPRLVARITSTFIARRFWIRNKGDITPGFDADLWLVDLSHEGVVRREALLYKNQFSVHEGQKIRGHTVRTLVRGRDPAPGVGKQLTRRA